MAKSCFLGLHSHIISCCSQHSGRPTKAPLLGIHPHHRVPKTREAPFHCFTFYLFTRDDVSFSLSLTKQTFKCTFLTLHFKSLCDILCLHQHCGLFAEWQYEMITSQMCSLKKITKAIVLKKLEQCRHNWRVPILLNFREWVMWGTGHSGRAQRDNT